MRVLVTGSSGYIGSVLTRLLISRGHEVRGVDTNEFGDHAPPQVETIVGDIRYPLPAWFEGVDAVCHLAGLSNDPTSDFRPDYAQDVNVAGTYSMGLAAVCSNIQRFTFASSASIYDFADPSSWPEVQDEESVVEPMGSYSTTKFDAELELLGLSVSFKNFCPTILRQATVYGDSPRMRFDLVVNTMTRAALQNGVIQLHGKQKTWRPLISVENVALAHAKAIEAPLEVVGGRTFNVSEGDFTIDEVAYRVSRAAQASLIDAKVETVDMPEGRRIRNYRMSTKAWESEFGHFSPTISASVRDMISRWRRKADLFDPIYENMATMAAHA